MAMQLSKEDMKDKIFGYLEYMDDRDIREISTAIYNLHKRRETVKLNKERDAQSIIIKEYKNDPVRK